MLSFRFGNHLLCSTRIGFRQGRGGILIRLQCICLGNTLLVESEDGQAHRHDRRHGEDHHQGSQEVARTPLQGCLLCLAFCFECQTGLKETALIGGHRQAGLLRPDLELRQS